MTKNTLLLPGAITSGLVALSYAVSWYYWDSGLYHGRIETGRPSGESDILSMFLVVSLVFFVKYFIYDVISRRYARGPTAVALFYLGYLVAVCIDAASIFLSFSPLVAAGFAILAAILLSPLALFIAWVLLFIGAKLGRKND